MANAVNSAPVTFEVSPPSIWAPLSMIAMVGLIPLGVMLYAVLDSDQGPAKTLQALWPPIGFVLVMLPVLLLLMRRRSVTLDGGMLHIRAAMYGKRVAVAELDLEHARTVDLDERTELRPGWRSNGYATIGYTAGHYQMRNRQNSAFCLLTQRQRVLWLPLRNGKQHILLSLERPQLLLEALRGQSSP